MTSIMAWVSSLFGCLGGVAIDRLSMISSRVFLRIRCERLSNCRLYHLLLLANIAVLRRPLLRNRGSTDGSPGAADQTLLRCRQMSMMRCVVDSKHLLKVCNRAVRMISFVTCIAWRLFDAARCFSSSSSPSSSSSSSWFACSSSSGMYACRFCFVCPLLRTIPSRSSRRRCSCSSLFASCLRNIFCRAAFSAACAALSACFASLTSRCCAIRSSRSRMTWLFS